MRMRVMSLGGEEEEEVEEKQEEVESAAVDVCIHEPDVIWSRWTSLSPVERGGFRHEGAC